MMSYKKSDDKETPFPGYRQITIALIRPRLLPITDPAMISGGFDVIVGQPVCQCVGILPRYYRAASTSFPTVCQTTRMSSLVATYDVPKTFQIPVALTWAWAVLQWSLVAATYSSPV
jgi:hypothetical protein